LPSVAGRQAQGKVNGEEEAFERLKAELARAFAVPEGKYQALTAEEIIARNLSKDD